MRKSHLILCLAGTALVSACNYGKKGGHEEGATNVDTAAAAESIKQEETQSLADWTAKDAAKVTSHYAEGATLMLPGMASMTGATEIRPAVDGAVKDANFSLSFQAQKVEVAQAGDLAFSRGTYSETYSDPKTKQKVSESGSYVTVWKKQEDGSWKAVEDIATPGPAMPAPQAEPPPA